MGTILLRHGCEGLSEDAGCDLLVEPAHGKQKRIAHTMHLDPFNIGTIREDPSRATHDFRENIEHALLR